MNRPSDSRLLLLFTAFFLAAFPARARSETTQWDFDGDFESTTGQEALEELFAAPAEAPEHSFETVTIGGQAADVLYFSRGTYFRVRPGLPPNGGGQYVNQYTIILDVMFPDRSPSEGWASLLQTNEANANDGDWFVSPEGGVGISGNYGGSVPEGEWHRLALVMNLVAGTFTSFVDGAQVQQLTGQGLDGRFSLYSVNDGFNDGFSIFADDTGDNAEGYINSIQYRDLALSPADIAAMGGPSADGIPIPEDPRDCSFRQFTAAYDASANTVNATWLPLAGENGFHVLRSGSQLGGDLPASATSFDDKDPPDGGTGIVYTLVPLRANGTPERECAAAPVDTFGCISGLACCVDQATRHVALSWIPPTNIVPTGFRVRRDGLDVGTAGSAESSFTDDAAVPTGSHVYEVALLSGQNALCAASCRVTVTGVPIGSAGACGGVVNTYDFDGDLKSSTGGRDLVPFVSLPIDLVTGTPDFSFETAEIAGKEAQVCRYSRGTCFRLYTGFGPNGGGIYTNQYTIVFDLLFEPAALDESGWAALYQTNDVNGNDGDYFIRAQDRGVGIDDNYGGYVADGEWHRVAVVVDLVAGTLRSYVDGAVAQENAAQGRDGRFSLYSTADGDLEGISVFADDSGDNSPGLVGSVQIRDVPLSEEEVRAFGGPSADGIPPQPLCPYGLACRLELASKTVTLEWNPGAAPGTALVVKRNGEEIASVPAGASTYTDPGVPAGALVYELAAQAAASCANLPLVTEVFVPKSSYFFEDFDAYEDDAALAAADWESNRAGSPAENADWTVLNPGRRPPPPTFNGRPSGGRFVISDSAYAGSEAVQNEAGSGAAYELWSPSFSTQGAASVWLHFDAAAQLNNNGDAVFNVDVSTDGGASWSNVLERVSPGRQLEPLPTLDGNADGLHGRVHVDLTADAANKPSVRLRFTHFEPTWDWWVALDNVLVDGDSPDGGGPVVLPAESFSGGIPAAWKHDPGPGSDGADPWSTEDTCQLSLEATGGTFPDTADGRQLHHLGGAFALIDPICSAALVDEYLITPAFDLSGQARAILSVRSAILFTHTAVAEILLSLDGGATFLPVPVFRYGDGSLTVSGEEPYFDELSIDVPAAVGKANVAFAFHYAGNQPANPAKGWWAIDDVSVTGGETVGLPRFHRGDADDNGQLQLTDAIRILGRLFLGQGTISCEDAADSDDSGSLQLTDAIRILGVLFLGQGEIPPPGGPPAACGVDPGEDALGCESYSSCN